MDRNDIVLLAIASGLVIAVIAISFTLPVFSREMTKELCQDSDGAWNGTGCLCSSSFQCPPGFYCRLLGVVQNETGKCEPR